MDYSYTGFDTSIPPDPFNFDMKGARRHISRLGIATAVYVAISVAVLLLSELFVILFAGDGAEKILTSDLYLWGMQVLAMYVIAFPVFYLMTRGVPKKHKKKSRMDIEELFWLFFIAELFAFIGSSI